MEILSALRKQIFELNKKRADQITRVLNTKSYIAAQVYERYKKCGDKNCKCAKGELHGPFIWIYQNKKGHKVVSTTVAKGKIAEAREMAERYARLLQLRHLIREADQEMNKLLNEFETHLEKEITEYVKRKEKA